MPAKGFRNATVREDAYTVAEKIAEEDQTSVSDVVSKAIVDYGITRAQLLSKAKGLLRLIENLPAESGSL